MTRGTNFLMRVGIVQLERWLGGCSGPAALRHTSDKKVDERRAGRYEDLGCTMRTLPLKSRRFQKAQQERRHQRDKAEAEAKRREGKRVDWVAHAHKGIVNAKAAMAAKAAAAREAEMELLHRAVASASPRASSPRHALPPLMRWEVPRALEELQSLQAFSTATPASPESWKRAIPPEGSLG